MAVNAVGGDKPVGSEDSSEGETDIVAGIWDRFGIADSESNQSTVESDSLGDSGAATGDTVVSVPLRDSEPLSAAPDRAAGLRPPRLDLTYSHVMPRAIHFEHDGFCLWHLTLDDAHATQLSRSLGTVGAVAGCGGVLDFDVLTAWAVVDRDVAMMLRMENHKGLGRREHGVKRQKE